MDSSTLYARSRTHIILWVFCFVLIQSVGAQPFVLIETPTLPTQSSAEDWGDFDGDGDFDLMAIVPEDVNVKLFVNQGDFQFDHFSIHNAFGRYLRWHDYDGDDDLDLYETATLFQNTGKETFVEVAGLTSRYVEWGDIDGDGDVDMPAYRTQFTQFDSQTWRERTAAWEYPLPGKQGAETQLSDENIILHDFDRDGDLDVLSFSRRLSGLDGVILQRQVAPNAFDTTVVFREINWTINYAGWADFDGDNDSDLLLTVTDFDDAFAYLYVNDQSVLTPETIAIPVSPATSIGDIDLDGDMDIVVIRNEDTTGFLHLFLNTGAGVFEETVQQLSFPVGSLFVSEIHLLDIDKDDDLDIYFTHHPLDNIGIRFLRNDINATRPAPDAPVALQSSVVDGEVLLEWQPPVGNEADVVAYRLQLGTTPGGKDMLHPQTNPVTHQPMIVRGLRNWPAPRRKFPLLPAGTYYWSVQAIDASGKASPHSAEASFTKEGPPAPVFQKTGENMAQSFTSPYALGDFDADGDLDVFAADTQQGGFILQNENGTLSLDPRDFPFGGVELRDFDGDGDLDAVSSGSQFFENLGAEGYRYLQYPDLDGGQCIAIVDYDQDGDEDVVSFSDEEINLHQNNGNLSFSSSPIAGLWRWDTLLRKQCDVFDFDADGDLDLFVAGTTNLQDPYRVWFYQNDGAGGYEPAFELENFITTSHDVGDFDGDGDDDFLISGVDPVEKLPGLIEWRGKIKIYRNDRGDGLNVFEDGLPAIIDSESQTAWVDVDSDGDLDLHIYGAGHLQVYVYDAGAYSLLETRLPDDFFHGEAIWGDIDGDRSPDMLHFGRTPYDEYVGNLYLNTIAIPNTSPETSAGLSSTVNEEEATLSWMAGADAESGAVTYHLRVGSTPGGEDVSVGAYNAGLRQILEPGNAGFATSFTLKDLPIGTYYWSVQAVDNAYNASEYAAEASFEITESQVYKFTSIKPGIKYALNEARASWGDYDGDEDLDVLIIADFGEGGETRLYENEGDMSFTQVDAGLPQYISGVAAWGDYDGDGDLDLAFSGETAAGERQLELIRNVGDGVSDGVNQSFIADTVLFSNFVALELDWIDHDNDGDLDLPMVRASVTQNTNYMFRNDGTYFSRIQTNWPPGTPVYAAWEDFDLDHDIDVYYDDDLLVNNDGVFKASAQEANFFGYGNWVDFDVDGDPDLSVRQVLFENNAGTLTLSPLELPLGGFGSSAWGDVDNDGDPDRLWNTGQTGYFLENAIDSLFVTYPGVRGGDGYDVTWIDFDKDGRRDVVVMEEDAGMSIYKNRGNNPNTSPAAPDGLTAEVVGGNVELAWQPAEDMETPSPGLRYNVSVGSAPGLQDVMPAMAMLESGVALLPDQSNVGHNTGWSLRFLENGTYYWRVQAVDMGGGRSAFSAEQTFTITQSGNLAFEEVDLGLRFSDVSDFPPVVTVPQTNEETGIINLLVSKSWGNQGSMGFLEMYELTPAGGFQLAHTLDSLRTEAMIRARWGDYDNDGDGDVLTASYGFDVTKPGYLLNLLTNNGPAGFDKTSITNDSLYALYADWADVENDGRLDIVMLSRTTETDEVTAHVLRNDPESGFVSEALPLPDQSGCAFFPVDVDTDGDLDFLTTGLDDPAFECDALPVLYIYENEAYERVPLSDANAFARVDWGDYDADGDPDLLVLLDIPFEGTTVLTGAVLRNEGQLEFSVAFTFPAEHGELFWVDLNSDGYLDIYHQREDDAVAYAFQSNQTFSVSNVTLPEAIGERATWLDYDRDHRMDLLISQYSSEVGSGITTVLLNQSQLLNTPPAPPANLRAEVAADTILFRWDAGADAETPAAGLSYHLQVGTTPGGSEILSVLAATSLRRGNAGYNLSWPLHIPNDGTYYWGVHAIDAGNNFSEFAEGPVITPVFVENEGLASEAVVIHGNYPNPFTQTTNFVIDLPAESYVSLELFDAVGRSVYQGSATQVQAGARRRLPVSIESLSSGVYFYTLKVDSGQNISYHKGRLIIVRQ